MSDAEEAWEKWWRSTFFPREQWSQFQTAYKAGFAAGQVAAVESVTELADRWENDHDGADDCETCWLIQDLRARAAELSKEQHDQPDAQFPN